MTLCVVEACDRVAMSDERPFCTEHKRLSLLCEFVGIELAFEHELALMDLIIDRDTQGGFVDHYGHKRWRWTSFLVANRSVEQAIKFFAPLSGSKRAFRHKIKSGWADVVRTRPGTPEHDLYGTLDEGYRLWNGLFQSGWGSLDALLEHVETLRNRKEYLLIEPTLEGAQIDPMLPLALADIARMVWRMGWRVNRSRGTPKIGVRFGDTSVGEIRRVISRIFEAECGVNLNLDLLNAKTREHGWLPMWSLIFHILCPSKYTRTDRIPIVLKFRDGQPAGEGSRPGEPYETYHQERAVASLVDLFGEEQLADAHVDAARVMLKSSNWRLRYFIQASEHTPLVIIDGMLTDTSKGAWRRPFLRQTGI